MVKEVFEERGQQEKIRPRASSVLRRGGDMSRLGERGMEEYKGRGGYGAFFIGESWLPGDL